MTAEIRTEHFLNASLVTPLPQPTEFKSLKIKMSVSIDLGSTR
jgi:hypothetical protein